MIVQEFLLEEYDWVVRVYYAIRGYNYDAIEKSLQQLKASEAEIEDAFEDFYSGRMNVGHIYSNLLDRKSVLIIGPTSSADEFQNTFDHEKGHLAMHICLADDIDPFSEKYQYLVGTIGQEMFKVGKMFMCDHCREGWAD